MPQISQISRSVFWWVQPLAEIFDDYLPFWDYEPAPVSVCHLFICHPAKLIRSRDVRSLGEMIICAETDGITTSVGQMCWMMTYQELVHELTLSQYSWKTTPRCYDIMAVNKIRDICVICVTYVSLIFILILSRMVTPLRIIQPWC